jgi:hypothetical protein
MEPTEVQLVEFLLRADEAYGGINRSGRERSIARLAYAAGADAELKACCDAIYLHEEQPLCGGTAEWLRAARRPKPSLKQRVLHVLGDHGDLSCAEHSAVAHALESLPDK